MRAVDPPSTAGRARPEPWRPPCAPRVASRPTSARGLLATHANRGRVHRWLGSLGRKNGVKDHEAASIASLIGKRSAAEALKNAVKAFRSLPLFKLTREELARNTPDPAMHAKTDKATLGTVDAFVSHSWSDPGDAKFKQLHEWAGGEDKSIWLDKVSEEHTRASPPCLTRYHSRICPVRRALISKTSTPA